MPTAQEARAELARRELARRGVSAQADKKPGLMGQAWNALKVPEQKSREGLGMLSKMVPEFIGGPSNSVPLNIAKGTPRVLADTMAEVSPGFVSRGSILMAGASPALKLLGKGLAPVGEAVAGQMEDWAGVKPGALKAAAKDASLIFSRGPKSAKPYYQAGQDVVQGSKIIQESPTAMGLVRGAEGAAKAGKLAPEEALEARKAVDQLYKNKNINRAWLDTRRKLFDSIAKESQDITKGDTAFKRGTMAQSLRSLFPKNVGGRASPFKVGEAMALSHMGPLGKMAGMAFSPLALGAGATALGEAGRIASNPASAVTAMQVLQMMRKKKNNENPVSQ